jgi:3-isopropylmalate dehydrogenase
MASVCSPVDLINNTWSLYGATGPDVIAQATRVLELISATSTSVKLNLEPHDFGGCAIDKYGEPLPQSTLTACQEADAILMGE